MRLNHKQTSVLALILAAMATIVLLHNPFAGYENSTYWVPTGGTYEWQPSRQGCTPELKQELSALEGAELAPVIAAIQGKPDPDTRTPMQKAADSMTGKRAQIYRQCMKYVENSPQLQYTPFLEWQSDGSYFWQLRQMKALLISIAVLLFWGTVIIFMFRTPASIDKDA